MEHPDISVKNANLYYANMLAEAENSRRAKKLGRSQPKGKLFLELMKRLPVLHGKSIERPVSSVT